MHNTFLAGPAVGRVRIQGKRLHRPNGPPVPYISWLRFESCISEARFGSEWPFLSVRRLTASIHIKEVPARCCVEIKGLSHRSITGDHE